MKTCLRQQRPGYDDGHAHILGDLLEPRGDIHRVTENSELQPVRFPDCSAKDLAPVHTDTDTDT